MATIKFKYGDRVEFIDPGLYKLFGIEKGKALTISLANMGYSSVFVRIVVEGMIGECEVNRECLKLYKGIRNKPKEIL